MTENLYVQEVVQDGAAAKVKLMVGPVAGVKVCVDGVLSSTINFASVEY